MNITQILDQQEAQLLNAMPQDANQFKEYMDKAISVLKKEGYGKAAVVLIYACASLANKKARQLKMEKL